MWEPFSIWQKYDIYIYIMDHNRWPKKCRNNFDWFTNGHPLYYITLLITDLLHSLFIPYYALAIGYDSPHILFTLGCASYNFVIPTHYHLQNFVCYLPYNDIIFSQSTQSFHFTSCQNMYKCLPKNYSVFLDITHGKT
jgi:hypothetical protein